MKKIAVVMFNLGGPDRPEAVKPFLLNLFNDPAIIRLPAFVRPIVARFIVARRAAAAAAIYAKIGGRSPILANTQAQAQALERQLAGAGQVKCFIAMRYWHPLAGETARAVKKFAPDEIILLPLYPQFSTTTTGSSFKSWQYAAAAAGLDVPAKIVCCYPDQPGFIGSMAQMTGAAYEKAKAHGKPRVLFSAHGLPSGIVKAGDPYPSQCERTVAALVEELAIENLDGVLCYQSRVGPLEWIGPSTDEEIFRAGRARLPVVVVPIAFVSEHSETLVEIDMLYRELAAKAGVPYFDRVPAVGAAPVFIEGLAALVRQALKEPRDGAPPAGTYRCSPGFCGCFRKSGIQPGEQTHAV